MSLYAYNIEGYFEGIAVDLTQPRLTDVAPGPSIPPAHARWDGSQWITDPSREQAKACEILRTAAVEAVQKRHDEQAREWGFDSMADAGTYVVSKNDLWRREAIALTDWRDASWLVVEQNHTATADELLALLPAEPTRPT